MRKKGSVILLALFMVLFSATIISILYLTNKRYLILFREHQQNNSILNKHRDELLSLYLVNMFARNNGVINVKYNVNRIYANRVIHFDLYTTQIDQSINLRVNTYLLNNFLYSNVYDTTGLVYESIKLFNHNIWHLYLYDSSRGYIYTPREIIDVFKSNKLTNSEKRVLDEYRNALIGYIMEVFGISPDRIQIVTKYNYSDPQMVGGTLYQSNKRRIQILIGFVVNQNSYFLYSEFYIKNDLKGVKVNHSYHDSQLSIYTSHNIRSYIYKVIESKVKRGDPDWQNFPYSL